MMTNDPNQSKRKCWWKVHPASAGCRKPTVKCFAAAHAHSELMGRPGHFCIHWEMLGRPPEQVSPAKRMEQDEGRAGLVVVHVKSQIPSQSWSAWTGQQEFAPVMTLVQVQVAPLQLLGFTMRRTPAAKNSSQNAVLLHGDLGMIALPLITKRWEFKRKHWYNTWGLLHLSYEERCLGNLVYMFGKQTRGTKQRRRD